MTESKNIYGSFSVPSTLNIENVTISVYRENEFTYYQRDLSGTTNKKYVFTCDDSHFTINPVEPQNVPKKLTSHMLIELENPLLVGSGTKKTIYITFPVEIGIFFHTTRGKELIDVFSLNIKKFTLYGNPNDGIICKYYKSSVYPKPPEVNSMKEGVLEVEVVNNNGNTVEVRNLVFSAYGMKIFYDNKTVSMKAILRTVSRKVAETDFLNDPIHHGMVKSPEIYVPGKMHYTTKYIMDKGL